MKIAVLSDLHIGCGDSAERFLPEDAAFLRLLDDLEGTHDRIFLLGDVWETLTHPMIPGSSFRALEAARKAHPLLSRRFASERYVHFAGNHDPVTRAEGAHHQLMVRCGGARYLFLHGDIFDDTVAERPWVSSLGVYAGGWLLRLGMHELFRSFEQDSFDRVGSSDPDGTSVIRQRARSWAQAHGADVIVMGHTHKAVIADRHPTTTFLNSGSCLGPTVTWLSIDAARDAFSLFSETLPVRTPDDRRREAGPHDDSRIRMHAA